MKWIVLTNIFSIALVSALYQFKVIEVQSHPEAIEEQVNNEIREHVVTEHKANQKRETASIKCAAEEFIKQRPNLEPYLIKEDSWEDQFTHFYTHNQSITFQGEPVHLTKVLKPFYESFYRSLKEEFGDKAKEKMLSYFEFKQIYEDERSKIMSINMYDYNPTITEDVTKYRRKLIESGEYSSDELEELVANFINNEKMKHKINAAQEKLKQTEEHLQEYRTRLIKLFGENQLDNLSRLIESKNDELHGTYGNSTYKNYRPDQKDEQQRVLPSEVDNYELLDSDRPLIKIHL